MNIVIAGHFDFPTGSAAASRIRHFSRGLTELAHRVHVVCMVPGRPVAGYDYSDSDWVELDGVRYTHAAGIRDAGARMPTWRRVTATLAQLHRAVDVTRQRIAGLDHVDAVIGYSDMAVGCDGLVRFCKKRRIPIVRDVVEWFGPESFAGGRLNPMYWNSQISYRRSLAGGDGIIGISSFITDYFTARSVPAIRVPAVIDPDVIATSESNEVPRDNGPFRLTYLGNMNLRDGPFLMVDAVRAVVERGGDVFFNVIGNTDPIPAARQARRQIEADPNLRDRVRFWGRVSDEEVTRGLLSSDALIFTRLSGRASQAAFPTRLPEYLVSGRPVIASDVSDIAEYLRDGTDAIIVKADSASALAEGIERLLRLPDRGRSIGVSGKQRCREHFDYARRSAQIAEFLARRVEAVRTN